LTPLSEALIMLTDMIGIGLVVVMIQKILLQYVYHNALAVFLPVGIGFKAIPFLRKTGATIIAATLVMYFIFPMSLWINEQIYFNSLFSYNDDTGEYMPDMIDWTNYESIMQVTAPESSEENYNELYGRIRTENVEPFYEQTNTVNDAIIEDVYGEEVTSRLPRAVHRAVLNSFKDNGAIVGGYFFHYASILGPMLPIEYFFGAITDMFTTSMQWFALNLLFLANTIILCVTFFKDLSIAIGGEPRIFGMSRLL